MEFSFVDGGYERFQKAIQVMASRYPEAKNDLFWLSWYLISQTTSKGLQEYMQYEKELRAHHERKNDGVNAA